MDATDLVILFLSKIYNAAALKKWTEEATNSIKELPPLEPQKDSHLSSRYLLMKLDNPALLGLLQNPQTDPYVLFEIYKEPVLSNQSVNQRNGEF